MALKKNLTVTAATVIALNAMIGAGIFSMPLALYKTAGPLGLVTILFIASAVWCLAFALGKIAEQNPRATSFYDYIIPWGGTTLASSVTLLYTCGMITAMGLLTQSLGNELHTLVPAMPSSGWSALTLSVLTSLLMQGVTISTIGQYFLIASTVVPLFAISTLCFLHSTPAYLVPFAPHGFMGALMASKIIIFGYFGFECVMSLTPLLNRPQRSLPVVLMLSIGLVSLLYFGFISSIMLAVPQDVLLSAHSFMEALFTQFPHKPWILSMVTFSVISAITGTLHAMLWSASSLLNSLQSHFYKTPITHVSHILTSISVAIFAMCFIIQNPGTFFSIVALCVVPTYFVTVATVFQKNYQYSITTKMCGVIGWLASLIITVSAFYSLAG